MPQELFGLSSGSPSPLSKEMLSSKPGPVDLLLSLPLGLQTRHKVSKGIKSSSCVTLRTAMAEGRE